jgi:hypothetical protein
MRQRNVKVYDKKSAGRAAETARERNRENEEIVGLEEWSGSFGRCGRR